MAINKTLGNIFKGDKPIWIIFFILALTSVVEVFSASSGLTYKGGSIWAPILKHVGILVLGVFAMVVVMNVKCKYFRLATPLLLAVAVVTLIWVMVAGQVTNGASRWMNFLGIPFQPSELGKGALVLATAQILSALQTDHGADKKAIGYVLVVGLPIILLIFRENFSTAVLLFLVMVMMMFIGRVPIAQIGKLLGVVTFVAVLFLTAVMTLGQDDEEKAKAARQTEQAVERKTEEGVVNSIFHRFGTWKTRINEFLNNEDVPPEKFDLNNNSQVGHSNIAIVSSNIIGKGPGNSVERDFLPQAFSDFIYAIIIEELGIVGALIVAMVYVMLLFRTARIAGRCENCFPAFLAMGLALLLVSQALFNMLVAVGLAPVTGQPLPLVSKGGTSTVINCVYLGVILSISRTAKRRDTPAGPEAAPAVAKAADTGA